MGWIRQHRVSCIIVLAALVATAVYYPYSQQARMARAERHIPKLQQTLAADPRFQSVQLEPFTGRGGSLLLRGTLASQAERDALVAIVQQSNPPVEVVYRIEIAVTTRAATDR